MDLFIPKETLDILSYLIKEPKIGKMLYEEYAAKIICSEQKFTERLKYWAGEFNGR